MVVLTACLLHQAGHAALPYLCLGGSSLYIALGSPGQVAARLGLPLVGLHTPVQQVVDLLGNADAYIGGRWHPSIFALREGAPIIPLTSRTFKMEALARLAGLTPTTHDALDLGVAAEGIAGQLSGYLGSEPHLRDRLLDWGRRMARESSRNLGFLSDIVSSRATGS